jgi:soluble lytic murein transglycosylase
MAMRGLGLKELEVAEFGALEARSSQTPTLREFVLAGYQDAGAWYEAIGAATRMEKRGEVRSDVAERLRYPRAYWDLIATAAQRLRLDPYLLLSLARQESLFNPKAHSSADARGLMQLLPSTARRVAGEAATDQLDLYDPTTSVELGSSYLRRLLDMFNGNKFKAVAAYNAGEHAVENWNTTYPGDDDQWVENIEYHETRDYVKKVIGGLREYQLIYPTARAGSPSP